MSFGKQFSEDLGAGMAFGAAIGAARRINEQDQAIERLIRDYNELVERFNVLLEQRNEALRERDGYKCSVIARRQEVASLLGVLRQAYGWGENSQAEADLKAKLDSISDAVYEKEMRALGYKIDGR